MCPHRRPAWLFLPAPPSPQARAKTKLYLRIQELELPRQGTIFEPLRSAQRVRVGWTAEELG